MPERFNTNLQGPARAAHRLTESIVRKGIEPALGGVNLWDRGLGEVCQELLRQELPETPITAVAIARNLGILKPEKKRR